MSAFEEVTIGECRLILGDCREVLPTLPKHDLLLTDPPYGIGFSHGGRCISGIGKGAYSTKFAGVKICGDEMTFDPYGVVSAGHLAILWGGNHFCSRLSDSPKWLVWDKRSASGHSNDFADCEIAWTNISGVARVFRHHWDGMMKASEKSVPRSHPTQKPIALMVWCINQAGNPQTIIDPFMGSGTTGVACAQLGRKFTGIECERKYFDIACERIDNAYRQAPMVFTERQKPVQEALI